MNERQVATRAFWSAVDTLDAGQESSIPEADDEQASHERDAAIGGVEANDDQSGHDPGRVGETSDNGASEARAIGSGVEVDEGIADGPDRSQEQGGDDVLEPVPGERVEEESNASAGRFRDFELIGHAFGRF